MRPYRRPAATVSGDDKWTSRRVATAGRSNVALAAPSGGSKANPSQGGKARRANVHRKHGRAKHSSRG